MFTRMKQRRGLASEWVIFNPILSDGEIGYEKDTKYFKLGNGVNAWNDLPYLSNKEALDHIADTVDAHEASAILIDPIVGIVSTNVQGALAEVVAGGDTAVYFNLGTFSSTGALTVSTGTHRLYVERACTITKVRASVGVAPTGASILVDVNKNGTTIFTTQSNRPTIVASSFTDLADTIQVNSLIAGDYLTVDVDQIGSTIAGSDLTVTVEVLLT